MPMVPIMASDSCWTRAMTDVTELRRGDVSGDAADDEHGDDDDEEPLTVDVAGDESLRRGETVDPPDDEAPLANEKRDDASGRAKCCLGAKLVSAHAPPLDDALEACGRVRADCDDDRRAGRGGDDGAAAAAGWWAESREDEEEEGMDDEVQMVERGEGLGGERGRRVVDMGRTGAEVALRMVAGEVGGIIVIRLLSGAFKTVADAVGIGIFGRTFGWNGRMLGRLASDGWTGFDGRRDLKRCSSARLLAMVCWNLSLLDAAFSVAAISEKLTLSEKLGFFLWVCLVGGSGSGPAVTAGAKAGLEAAADGGGAEDTTGPAKAARVV